LFVLVFITSWSYAQEANRSFFENTDVVVIPQKFNTISSDISPLIIGDKLFYSSVRENYFNKNARDRRNTAFYDMYMLMLDENGRIVSDRQLAPGFGNKFHEGPAAWCGVTGELVVTLSNVINPDTIKRFFPKEHIRLRIAIMKLIQGNWQISEELPFVLDNFHYAHPAISITGDTLVFSSDQSSGNVGKADLWMSVRKNGKWGVPVNLGSKVNTEGNEMFPSFSPDGLLFFSSDGHDKGFGQLDIYFTSFPNPGNIINAGSIITSAYDDFGLTFHPNRKVAYFTSNRTGIGSDDIYMAEFSGRSVKAEGRVVAELSGNPIPGANVRITDCNGNELKSLTAQNDGTFGFEASKSQCYQIEGSCYGYLPDLRKYEGKGFIELRLRELKKYRLLVLDKDNNKPLSDVIATWNGNEWNSNSSGFIEMTSENVQDRLIRISRLDYLDQTVEVNEVRFLNRAEVIDTVWLYRKDIGRTFVLENIYYDFDKWDILPESEVELNKLVSIMKDNPTLKVELGSHTDSRGSDKYNRILSQRRSDSAVRYIIEQGIEAERIVAKGYGESQLVNHCANGVRCSDEEHRKNRRTEFKIIGYL